MREPVAAWVALYRRNLWVAMWRLAFFQHSLWWVPVAACLVLGARLLQMSPSFGFYFLVALPIPMLTALWSARRALPSSARLTADLDARYRCGGLLLAADQEGCADWSDAVSERPLPVVRATLGVSFPGTLAAWLFLALVFGLPAAWFEGEAPKPLMIQPQVTEKEAQIAVLEAEKLIDRHHAEKLRETLRQVTQQAEKGNPAETWQALDAMQRVMENQVRAAWLARKQEIQQAEMTATVGSRIHGNPALGDQEWQDAFDEYQQFTAQMRKDNVLFDQALTDVGDLQGLSRLEAGAKLVDLKRVIKLSKEEMEALRARLKANALNPDGDTGVLVEGDLDGDAALAAFLAGQGESGGRLTVVAATGGVSRGPGSVPIGWTGNTAEGDDPFQPVFLPKTGAGRQDDSVRLAVSREAPQVGERVHSTPFDGSGVATGGTGSANRQQVLPRHRAAVGRYFEREDKDDP